MSKTKNTETTTTIPAQKVGEENVAVRASAPKIGAAQKATFLFDKQNYILMFIGLGVIILGYILMSGGKSADPNVFDDKAIYSFTRITLAPILVILGLVIEGYAIMKKPK